MCVVEGGNWVSYRSSGLAAFFSGSSLGTTSVTIALGANTECSILMGL